MAYYEGEISPMNSNGGMFGNDGWWGIILLALLFGWGRNGFGGAGGYGSSPATQADLASGFAQNTLQRGVDDIILGQANIQQTLCQGFNGVNTSILTSANATERGFASLGYNLANCCCDLKGAIADVKYANEKQTCDIIQAINAGNQRLVDIYTSDKISALQTENATLKGQISNNAQSAYIINALKPQATPAYVVPNPNCCYTPCGTSTL